MVNLNLKGATYIPCYGTVIRFSDVVHALTMPSKEQNFIVDRRVALTIEPKDFLLEELPLRKPVIIMKNGTWLV